MNVCDGAIRLRDFGTEQTRELLDGAVTAIGKAAKSPQAEPVHKMRVSIRRLQQALRLFRQFLPKRGVKRVRRDLKRIMEPAGELRNHDIAMKLARRLGHSVPQLAERRAGAKQALRDVLQDIVRPDLQKRWRSALGIETDEKETLEA